MTIHQVIRALWLKNKEKKRSGWKPFGMLYDVDTIERPPEADIFTSLYGPGLWEAVRDADESSKCENIWIDYGHHNVESGDRVVIEQLTCVIRGRYHDDFDGWVEGKTWQKWDECMKEKKNNTGGMYSHNISDNEYFPIQIGISLPEKYVKENCKGCDKFSYMSTSHGTFQSVWCKGEQPEKCKEEARRWIEEWLEE